MQRAEEDIEKLNSAKVKLQEEIEKNDVAGNKLLLDSQACAKVKEECQKNLEEKKNDFLAMKKEMAELDAAENQMKEELDKLMKERQICKDKCDRIKTNIRANRIKFSKNVEEFGDDAELEQECGGGEIDVEEELAKSSK